MLQGQYIKRLLKAIILLAVLYAYESWSLTLWEKTQIEGV